MSSNIRILLVDDHVLFRTGLRALLEAELGFQVIGEAGTGEDGIAKARRLRPNVVVMDLSMPGSGGLEAVRRLKALESRCRLLVITMHDSADYLIPALDAGAAGFLSKTHGGEELLRAVRTVARGDAYLPPGGDQLLLQSYRGKASGSRRAPNEELSSREEEVLALTAEGYSCAEIGEKLFISPKTVGTYRIRVMKKLQISHRSDLVRYALKAGFLRDV